MSLQTGYWAVLDRQDEPIGAGETRYEAQEDAKRYLEEISAEEFRRFAEYRTVPCTKEAHDFLIQHGFDEKYIYVHAPQTCDELIDLVRK